MMTATVVLLLGVTALISFLRILRQGGSPKTRGALILLRTLLLALVALAFLQPSFIIERLSPANGVALLLDVSRSMNAYNPDSTVLPLLRRLDAGQTGSLVVRHFGDSLRKGRLSSTPDFSDRKSFLPDPNRDADLRLAHTIVIISDGNYSNDYLPADLFAGRSVYYLPMHRVNRSLSLAASLHDLPAAPVVGNPCTATVSVRGYATGTASLMVQAGSHRRTIRLDTGAFRREFSLPLSPASPGPQILRVETRLLPGDSSSADTLCERLAAPISPLPHRLTYSIYATRPSLDRRFLGLALRRREDLAEVSRGADFAVVLDRVSAGKALRNLKPGGIILFAGCLPCDARDVPADSLRYILPFQGPFAEPATANLPPSVRLRRCSLPPLDHAVPVLAGTLSGGRDTVPLVITGRHRGHGAVACAMSGFWRLDFMPLARGDGRDRPSVFSDHLLDLAREAFLKSLSERLLVYPLSPAVEGDSLSLGVVLPGEAARSGEATFTLKVSPAIEGSVFDTVLTLAAFGDTRPRLTLPPFSRGRIFLDGNLRDAGGTTYRFSDTLFVGEDRSEDAPLDQNVMLLGEIGRPIENLSDTLLRELSEEEAASSRRMVTERISISRSWPLLALIFLLLGMEWIVRRRERLE